MLVALLAIRQTHGDKGGFAASIADQVDGTLRQAAANQRINTPADPQDQGTGAGGNKIVSQEFDAVFYFTVHVKRVADTKLGDDVMLDSALFGS